MPLSLFEALFSHARAQPEAVAWESEGGATVSYRQVAKAVEACAATLGGVGLGRHASPRLAVEEELTWNRFAWVVACMEQNITALALSPYQASGRLEDLGSLWNAQVHVVPEPGRSRLHHRLDVPTSPADSPGVIVDLNDGANLPKLGLVSISAWTAHWEALIRSVPVYPGERVASLLPDVMGSWLDMCAVVMGQGGRVSTLPIPSSFLRAPPMAWPEDVLQLHLTAVQALLVDPATVPASAVGWIHGPCPAWITQRFAWAKAFPSLTPEPVLQWKAGLGASTDILYEFGLDTDPRNEWRKKKEQALTRIPGVVAAIVPVHPLRAADRRPVGVVCLEKNPQDLRRCKEDVARLCASDPDLALNPVVWMGYQGLGLSSMLDRGLVNNALSLVEHMADDLEHREKEVMA